MTGWCRSGTTMIGNLLNELDGVVHVGELRYLWRNGVLGDGTNTSCGCAEPVVDCPLWSKVLGLTGGADVLATARLWAEAQDLLVRTRHTARRLAARQSPAACELAARMAELYAAIAAVSGAHTIVDSSKFPAEAALLSGTDLRILHVVRDPRAVAHSWLRPKDYIPAMSPARSTVYWTGFNAASELVCLRNPATSMRLRYEDFVRDPRGGLADILRLLGLRAEPPIGADGLATLGVNHTVTGNPDRFAQGRVRVRPDDRWRRDLPRRAGATATALAFPLLGRYGYPVRTAAVA
ncbi:sulfotransferase [Amycolatopsis xylanica]|uniref:sulfotransferase n=1 Tax=Amycolatopsis xylanica TaxID=589385 RepID=UPI001C40B42E|nr:sulfotransferase [Amycolatopsis xylanica]